MKDTQNGKIFFECDSCDEIFEGEKGEEFEVIWNAAKHDGWRTRKIAGECLHGCGKCGVPA